MKIFIKSTTDPSSIIDRAIQEQSKCRIIGYLPIPTIIFGSNDKWKCVKSNISTIDEYFII